VGPEGLAGGPIGKLRDDDWIMIVIDRVRLTGSINLIGEGDIRYPLDEASRILAAREPHPLKGADPGLPADTKLWAALQAVSGGTWSGCIYDADRIIEVLEACYVNGYMNLLDISELSKQPTFFS
jgi:dihydroxyacid dehydratase/phosphogluconate dehydratase